MRVEKDTFGSTADGLAVERFRLHNAAGVSVDLISYGAIVQSVKTPDRAGHRGEITLGFDALAGYLVEHPYFGAVIGRWANRIGGGRFTLDSVEYELACNNGPNHLHGGTHGFDRAVWSAESFQGDGLAGVRFRHASPDGDEGYPGTLDVTVTYTLDEESRLTIGYTATTDRPTPVNLTNHAYWNLSGAGSGDVLSHELQLAAEQYLPVDEGLIPTGELRGVDGTPMDFRTPMAIGSRFDEVEGGYDHCYVLGAPSEEPRFAARVVDRSSGRVLEVATTEPGIQLYTGNFLDGIAGTSGNVFEKHGALCLEAQHFPDAPNQPAFPNSILRPGETYRQVTVYAFGAE